MINFCNEGLADIDCKTPSCDGYSVKNLISVSEVRKKGFLVDYFVKPPVEVQLKFSCSVNVKKINLNCAVGLQKSSVFLISSETNNNSQSIVAKGSVNTSEKFLVFHLRGIDKDDCGKHETFYNTRNLSDVKSLYIKILQTEGSTIPALGSLEVWGYVSFKVPKPIKSSILKLWQNINSPKETIKNIVSDPPSVSSEKKQDIAKPFTIPDEFLDPITCDIFTIPMMLPSGKIVDIVTLERFYKAEEKWGRGRSDPFTGVLFTNDSKPVVATSLKERLDQYLMANSNVPVLKNIPRTVGRSITQHLGIPIQNNCHSYSSTSQYNPKISKRKLKDIDSLLEHSLDGLPSFLETSIPKKQKIECLKCNKSEILFKLPCEHFICRCCLVSLNRSEDNRCKCNEKINFCDVIRYHINI
ncbi:RING finger protein 37 [Halyomorpha halys]|uniref:RING finger protein 37 n=1 Tax=Halyomorpha halys TaxID=286706 RepID=UPI0006D4DC78|nr:RING finger protein 37 [Halyomorpha halys]